MRLLRVGVVVGTLLFLSGCGEKEEEPAAVVATPTPTPAVTATPSPTPFQPVALEIGDGIIGTQLTMGTGPKADDGDEVTLDLTVARKGDEKVWSGKFAFEIGSGMAFPGLDRSVRGMQVGEQREVQVPQEMGLPDHEELRVTMELLQINAAKE